MVRPSNPLQTGPDGGLDTVRALLREGLVVFGVLLAFALLAAVPGLVLYALDPPALRPVLRWLVRALARAGLGAAALYVLGRAYVLATASGNVSGDAGRD